MWKIAGLFYAASLSAPHAAIVVAYESAVEAYAEAAAGAAGELDPRVARLVDLSGPTGSGELARGLNAGDVRVVIAVGSRALAEVRAQKAAAQVVAAMTLHGGEGVAGEVELEVPLATQLEVMRALLPRSSRVGIIRSPARRPSDMETLEARARRLGFTLVPADSNGPSQLLKAVASLKGKVDFLLCSPDPDLYNAVTIKPLILASLDGRLPVVGFSPAFVRAGAAAGIYADYRESGRQAAAMATRLLRGEERAAVEEPSKVRVAVNQRMLHLLGLEFRSGAYAIEVMR